MRRENEALVAAIRAAGRRAADPTDVAELFAVMAELDDTINEAFRALAGEGYRLREMAEVLPISHSAVADRMKKPRGSGKYYTGKG